MLTTVINPVIRLWERIATSCTNVAGFVRQWWQNKITKGSEILPDEEDKERFKKINQFGLLLTWVLVPFTFVFHLWALPVADWRITIAIALYAALNYFATQLNRRWHKQNLAAFTIFATTCAAVAYFGAMMGKVLQLQFMVFFMLAIAFQLFRKPGNRALAFATAIGVLIFVQCVYNYGKPLVFLDPIKHADYIRTIQLLAMISVLVIVLLTSAGFVLRQDKSYQLEKSNRYIKNYMAHVTHEVRSPINAISLLSKKLHAEVTKNENYKNLEGYSHMLNMASINAQQVISNVLTLSEIEAGKPEPNIISTFNVKQFFTKLISVGGVLAQKKQISIGLLFDNIPSLISSDPHKISHIVNNLLSNAIKFGTKRSKVTVLVSVDESNGRWIIQVKNQGKPIPPEKRETIWDPFMRGMNGTLVPESSGLGLFITRNKVESLEGNIGFDCTFDGYTIFTVTLPLHLGKLKEVDLELPEEDNTPASFNGAKVLIAEDDALNARALCISLEALDCKATIAENGKELLLKASSMNYDLIIMDYHMPLMNGETAIRLLKSDARLRSIPVIVTTGDVYTDSLDKLLAAGADDYILKPIEQGSLAKVLSRALSASNGLAEENAVKEKIS
ncbi:response regulator [Pseudoflavitalea sp. G-6-1-2]|uniref:ATP-binding response regulator n=1 Tax=Pseudoflavitalea sp. G-6-1-2 TaxID=2728841 RepID=UPI00146D716A|nr:response regulator [Pseudoflavitalea sp. G-6-1-2]NML23502.1 response regulator [Pseudoflavitalea sp. G-6-1-2]